MKLLSTMYATPVLLALLSTLTIAPVSAEPKHTPTKLLTLKREATKPPGYNFLQQQSKFDDFIDEYNHERPHQALQMKYPGELYTPSGREYRAPEDPMYPYHDHTIRVTQCGRVCLNSKKISFSKVFAGQFVGVREVEEHLWLVSFLDFDLGYFEVEQVTDVRACFPSLQLTHLGIVRFVRNRELVHL